MSGMTVDEAMAELEALGNERMRTQNTRHGAQGAQFGVPRGEVRKLAKRIKRDHELGLALWETGNVDARFLAILLLKPKSLSTDELDAMTRSELFTEAADWFTRYVTRKARDADQEALRVSWMADDHPMAARAGWSQTAVRVAKQPEGLDLTGLLDRIEAEMGTAAPEVQWTMNVCLVEIGVHHPEHRERAIGIGEALGVYRDYPTSKGCTSPFAPEYIAEMVRRQ